MNLVELLLSRRRPEPEEGPETGEFEEQLRFPDDQLILGSPARARWLCEGLDVIGEVADHVWPPIADPVWPTNPLYDQQSLAAHARPAL